MEEIQAQAPTLPPLRDEKVGAMRAGVALFLTKSLVESARLDKLADLLVLSFADKAFLQVETHDIKEFENGMDGISFLLQQLGAALLAVEKGDDPVDRNSFLF